MLMTNDELEGFVESILLWCPEIGKVLGVLKEFDFRVENNTLHKPFSNKWYIKRTRGLPFVYKLHTQPQTLFNPHFEIFYRKRNILSLYVCVYRSSTHYEPKWNISIESVRDIENLWCVFDRILPDDILTHVETFLFGEAGASQQPIASKLI